MNTPAYSAGDSAWTLTRTLELEIENAGMQIARLRAVCAQARRQLAALPKDSDSYRRCRDVVDSCAVRAADLREYIADCRERQARLRRRQDADLSLAALVGAAVVLAVLFMGF